MRSWEDLVNYIWIILVGVVVAMLYQAFKMGYDWLMRRLDENVKKQEKRYPKYYEEKANRRKRK